MAQFLTKLEVELVDQQAAQGRGTWRLLKTFQYQSDVAKTTFTVPAGFVTDFASVPILPYIFTLVGDRASEAAVIHDWLYRTGTVGRKTSDLVLREAALACGCTRWQAWMLYLGVRIGGNSSYNGK